MAKGFSRACSMVGIGALAAPRWTPAAFGESCRERSSMALPGARAAKSRQVGGVQPFDETWFALMSRAQFRESLGELCGSTAASIDLREIGE